MERNSVLRDAETISELLFTKSEHAQPKYCISPQIGNLQWKVEQASVVELGVLRHSFASGIQGAK
jgi:hypothetical protein